jgi:selenocysteine-specific elongation factor
MRHVILGTAGHIDHGKSALVRALTGIDPDRLKEEKERGITIDLGFADLRYPDDVIVGIVDVPGHERLVKNMLAGAGGIDLVLLVIAADEGIMPQSREHLSICNLLRIKSGLIAITKTDLVEQDWLQLVEDDTRDFVRGTFLEKAPIITVSAKTLSNVDLLRENIHDAALQIKSKPTEGIFRLPIDRVFTLKGFGTVITGTAVSGKLSVDEHVEILPSGIRSKVRGLHSHGNPMQSAYAGQRVAINLQGVDKDAIRRGDSIVIPEKLIPTKKIDATVELLPTAPVLKSKSLVHFHLGTSETIARIILYEKNEVRGGERCYCQCRLREPVISMSGDRYIIRRFSPVETIGGGAVLDPSSRRRSKKEGIEDLKIFDAGNLSEKIATKIQKAGIYGIRVTFIEGWINEELPVISQSLEELKKSKKLRQFESILIHEHAFSLFQHTVKKILDSFHKTNPLKTGIFKEDLRARFHIEPKLFSNLIHALEDVVVEKESVRLKTFNVGFSKIDETKKTEILSLLDQRGFQPPLKDEIQKSLKIDQKNLSDMLGLMVKEGSLIRIHDTIYITFNLYEKMIQQLQIFYRKKSEMTVAEFRDLLGTSRKYALPFLEYLDSKKVTMRVGDVRKLLLK